MVEPQISCDLKRSKIHDGLYVFGSEIASLQRRKGCFSLKWWVVGRDPSTEQASLTFTIEQVPPSNANPPADQRRNQVKFFENCHDKFDGEIANYIMLEGPGGQESMKISPLVRRQALKDAVERIALVRG